MRWLPLILLAACTDPADDFVGTWQVYSGVSQIACPTFFRSRLDDGALHVIARDGDGELATAAGDCKVPLRGSYTTGDHQVLPGIGLDVDATLTTPSGYCAILGSAFLVRQ